MPKLGDASKRFDKAGAIRDFEPTHHAEIMAAINSKPESVLLLDGRSWLQCGLVVAVLAGGLFQSYAAVDAQREVWPILEKRCVECHGPDKQKSSLRVDSRAALLKGGDEGPALIAGDAVKSHLLALVSTTDKEKRMPPKGDALTADEIKTLRQWIEEGASWPEREKTEHPQARHWAFQLLTKPAVPATDPPRRNPIDAFITAKLSENGLKMSRSADPRTFIRRVTLDLTGLPPTPQEVEAFVAECAASSTLDWPANGPVAHLVDRLLASPRYGERWAQHWLDVIRYADTAGYEGNGIRATAWPYRDYVIAALNADIPYPRFIMEQLAGDTVGVDAATGFLVTAPFPSRVEIGQEPAAIAQSRYNGMDEVLQNISSSMLGMTVGCARCHDHKFDPVSANDYYRMAATFAGLQFVDRPWRNGAQPTAQVTAAEQKLAKIRRELAAFPASRETEPTSAVDSFAPVRAKYVRLTVTATVQKYAAAFDEIEVWSAASEGLPTRNVGSAKNGAVARSSGPEPLLATKDEFLNDGRDGVTSCWIAKSLDGVAKGFRKGEIWVEIELPEPTMINRVAWRCDHDDQGPDMVPLRWRYVTDWTIEVAEQPGEWRTVVSEDRDDGLDKAAAAKRKKLEEQYAEAAQELWHYTHLFAGRFRTPPDSVHFLSRGDPMQPRAVAGAGGIDILGGYELPPDAPEAERRVALAKWLGSEQHPLTARVLVNRVWRHHFGAGIVETPSDFGTQGERPSHPELLDWLAREFMARGWRLKELHRLICNSAAYRQSSAPEPVAEKLDAGARLLWRFPARRLEAEAIRDSVLFASGSLDFTMGGPGANVYQARNGRDMSEWKPLDMPGEDSWRRAIYLMRMRGADDGVFKPFDVPDCGQVRAKRSASTTPLQALNLFNSPFILDQAGRLAARAEKEIGADRGQQIERVFALTLARPPSAKEKAKCLEVATQHGLATVCRVIFNSNEFLFLQ